MSWEPVLNGEQDTDNLGRQLSRHIPCAVRVAPYSNHDKPIFECQHHLTFPIFVVKGAVLSGDWSMITESHKVVA